MCEIDESTEDITRSAKAPLWNLRNSSNVFFNVPKKAKNLKILSLGKNKFAELNEQSEEGAPRNYSLVFFLCVFFATSLSQSIKFIHRSPQMSHPRNPYLFLETSFFISIFWKPYPKYSYYGHNLTENTHISYTLHNMVHLPQYE